MLTHYRSNLRRRFGAISYHGGNASGDGNDEKSGSLCSKPEVPCTHIVMTDAREDGVTHPQSVSADSCRHPIPWNAEQKKSLSLEDA